MLPFAILLVWSEQHPVGRFRNRAMRLALANLLGHVVFAVGLAIAAWSLGFRYVLVLIIGYPPAG